VAIVLFLQVATSAQTVTIRASKPTHYYFTPAGYVNDPYDLVIGLHELSFAMPGGLAIQASLLGSIGRLNFGAKWMFTPGMSLGVGLASHTFENRYYDRHIGNYDHIGAYLALQLSRTSRFESVVVPVLILGDHLAAGVDFGLYAKPTNVWGVIFEAGIIGDHYADNLEVRLNMAGGLRINPPKFPFLYIDFGIDAGEFTVTDNSDRIDPRIYFDLSFAMKTN